MCVSISVLSPLELGGFFKEGTIQVCMVSLRESEALIFMVKCKWMDNPNDKWTVPLTRSIYPHPDLFIMYYRCRLVYFF